MPSKCTIEDTDNCHPVTHYSCAGKSTPDLTCMAMCDEYDPFNDKGTDCYLTCGGVQCSSFVTYHGPTCTFKSGCEQTVPMEIVSTQIPSAWNCEESCQEELQTEPPKGLPGPIPDPTEPCPDHYIIETQWNKHTFTAEITDEVYCVSPGNPIELDDGTVIECDDWDTQLYGDYWCPDGYEYDEVKDLCVEEADMCDQGFENFLINGCDDFQNPKNDTLYFQYQSNCVRQTLNVPIGLDVYDEMCCFNSDFNGFQIYEWDVVETHVKIY